MQRARALSHLGEADIGSEGYPADSLAVSGLISTRGGGMALKCAVNRTP